MKSFKNLNKYISCKDYWFVHLKTVSLLLMILAMVMVDNFLQKWFMFNKSYKPVGFNLNLKHNQRRKERNNNICRVRGLFIDMNHDV